MGFFLSWGVKVQEKVNELKVSFEDQLSSAKSTKELEDIKIKYLGKKGPIQSLMPLLKDAANEEKPLLGKKINELKLFIASSIEERFEFLAGKELEKSLKDEEIDVSMPGRRTYTGRMHPISSMIEETAEALIQMGFSVETTPEIESDYYNYGGLNYPEDHPARDMQDTFYLSKDVLLRSHNTSIQQRIMERKQPPIRVISLGKCYRNETITSRSHVLFHQVDALYIDKDVTFADLLATLKEFYSKLFKTDVELRVRPSYFPFVEPGMEVDVKCTSCKGEGCRLCKQTGWLEVCGAGMVHPEVLKQGGLDPEVYSGFAWGGGIERIFMLRHGISDIRMFTENDVRFLSQFA